MVCFPTYDEEKNPWKAFGMKIAILTYHRACNCGAMLQAWALKKVLTSLGHEVNLPDVRGFEERGRWYGLMRSWRNGIAAFVRDFVYQCFTLGIKEWIEYKYRKVQGLFPRYNPVSPQELSAHDLVVVGSDQVWNPAMGEYKLPLYLCEVIPDSVRAIGYAVSSGDSVPETRWDDRFARAMKRFDAVFVRERQTGEFISRASHVECEEVLDPSLLLTPETYAEIEEGRVPNEPYLFVYALATNDVAVKVPDFMRAVGVRRAVFFDGSPDFVPHRKAREYRRFISPGEFVRLVRNATAVVACSFHGVAFSVLMNKPFIALTPKAAIEKQRTRPGCFLRTVGCEERMFSTREPIDRMLKEIIKPLPEDVQERLTRLRKHSLDLLGRAIRRDHLGV